MRVPPSIWPPHTELFGGGTLVRRAGEEWFPEGLLGGVTGSTKFDSARRRLGARDARAWQDSHYFEGFLRWRVHRDENQIKEVFINEGRGHSPTHLKFFLLVFSKLKEDIK